jgi:hypothetical protein
MRGASIPQLCRLSTSRRREIIIDSLASFRSTIRTTMISLLKGGSIKVDTQELKQGVNELKKLFGK